MDTDRTALDLDVEVEAERICSFIRTQVLSKYRRKGVVIGLSGGVDSGLLACLCVRALGPDNVIGVILPEMESSPESELFGIELAESLGIQVETIDITPILKAFGVYEERNRVVRDLCEDFDPESDRMKIVLPPDLLNRDGLNVFSLIVENIDGKKRSYRLKPNQINEIVAAQNVKQRTRMVQLYFAAEKRHFIVGGTTNRTEMEQGFFVKQGDGGVDIEPLAHLYKTQVFQLAEHVGVTPNILKRQPSPDTWPGGVTDEEFFFRMPFDDVDVLLSYWKQGLSAEDARNALDFSVDQVERAFRDFQSKWNASWHLRVPPPNLVEETADPGIAVESRDTE